MANIRDITWNADPFDRLVLAEGQKEIILALVESRLGSASDSSFDDFVVGKGQGIIALLQYGYTSHPTHRSFAD